MLSSVVKEKLPALAALTLTLNLLDEKVANAQPLIPTDTNAIRLNAAFNPNTASYNTFNFTGSYFPLNPGLQVSQHSVWPTAATAHEVNIKDSETSHGGSRWDTFKHLMPYLLLGGSLVLLYKRFLPNILHVNIVQPAYEEFAPKKTPDNLKLITTTVATTSLSQIYHHDFLAFARFYAAMADAYQHKHWPIANFSNSWMMRKLLGGHAAEIIKPELLVTLSADIDYDATLDAGRFANTRLETDKAEKHPVANEFLGFITFEEADTRQPRMYLVPMANVINMLADFDEWWASAINSHSEKRKQKQCRQLEAAVSLLHRYPEAVKDFFSYYERDEGDRIRQSVDKAFKTADNLLKVLSLDPKPSAEFLDQAFHKLVVEPATDADLRKIYTTFYGVKDPIEQKKLLAAESGLRSFAEYDQLCSQHNLPMWLMMFHTTK